MFDQRGQKTVLRLRPGAIRRRMLERSAEIGKRITYEDLAFAAGRSWGTIERYVNERVSEPRAGVINDLARALACDLSDLAEFVPDESTGDRVGVPAV